MSRARGTTRRAAAAAPADPLATYNRKRDFSRTPEPQGKVQAQAARRFVVQKHQATRLHWDFRLEVDGVLKSWAVTRGPSLDPADKRLAVRTEDHPMDYGSFEGTIPKGEYGGGTVMLWDHGQWEPVPGKSAADLDAGHLHFRLHGERMRGEWLLVRMKPRPGETRENWLLRKIADKEARDGQGLVEQALTSISTGRTMAEIAAGAAAAAPKRALKQPRSPRAKAKGARRRSSGRPPAFVPVQLATLADSVPTGNGWMHEIKYDGYRVQAAVSGADVRLYTRTGLDWTPRFAAIAQALAELDLPPCLIDGEVVALGADGNPDFGRLAAAMKHGESVRLAYFAFDLLINDAEDLRGRPNLERKEALEALLAEAQPPVHVADHVIGAGDRLLAAICGAGGEGIISKQVDAAYHGRRVRSWLKVKCIAREEFVVIGWTPSTARARPFGALLLAQHVDGVLTYRGKVGTGFNAASLAAVAAQLERLARKTAPAEVPRSEARGAHWVKPDLVAEVAHAEITADGRVRHGSFIGLREDRPARSVVPEAAAPAPTSVTISNRDRIIFPESGHTKGDLADYYTAVAPLMLPHAAGRPISLVRCPQGRARKCFFQKHDSGSFGSHVAHVAIREKDGGYEDYLYLTDADGLLSCVQMGTIEFHGWGAHADEVEQPDRMVLDLDPDEGLDFAAVRKAARHLRDRLAELGLVSFAMLSGGKGVHVVVPLKRGHDWDTHKDFARRFAEALSAAEPERYTATMSKARRKGRIFIDWLRNQRGSTAVLPYSARARPGAPVAVPLSWDELATIKGPQPFRIDAAATLIERASTIEGWGKADQALPAI